MISGSGQPLAASIRCLANSRRLAAAGLLGAWGYLTALHGRYWRADIGLPPPTSDGDMTQPPGWPAVAVVLPARNEEQLLQTTLPLLLAQDYPGPVRVVVVDDASSDATAGVCRGLASAGGPVPLDVVAGTERPAGWVGKTWAVHQGLKAARLGFSPEYLLLTDADIAHPPGSLRALVTAARSSGAGSVSLMARLSVTSRAERLVVPAFVYFFSQLYPFARVNSPRWRTAAAAGGCILVRDDALRAAGGIQAVRGAVIDDVALARALKSSGARIWLGLASEVHSIRPYPRMADLWEMVARSAYTQLRHSAPVLALTMGGLVFLYIGPPALLVAGVARRDPHAVAAGMASWSAMTLSYLPIVRYYRLHPSWVLSLPAAAVLFGAMTLDSARRHHAGGGVRWKGRHY